jgi:hypothetical protein
MRGRRRYLALLAGILASTTVTAGQAPAPSARDLPSVLAALGDRVQQYFDRISSIICDETVIQQELKVNLAPLGKPRVTTFELSVSRITAGEGDSQFNVERSLQSVNGRRARKDQEPYCTDPKSGTPEPLAFLLAKNQHRFKFSFSAAATGGPAGAVGLEYIQVPPDRIEIKWRGDCFQAEGGGVQGRVWFDPQSFDVLEVDERLPKPFLVPLRRALGGPSLRVERSETTIRFMRVKFEQPEETVLLPESTEVLTVFRGIPSLRRMQRLSNFRRFLAEGKVRPAGL